MVRWLGERSPAFVGVVGLGLAVAVAKLVLDDPPPIVLGLIGGVGGAVFIFLFATVEPAKKRRQPSKPVSETPEKP